MLILSALGDVDDRVKGLRAGGDDYLTKPYAYSEFLARIEALARRAVPEGAGDALFGRRSRARSPISSGHALGASRSRCSRANTGCSNI